MNNFEKPLKKRTEEQEVPEPKDQIFNKPLSEVDLELHKKAQREKELQQMLSQKNNDA